MHAMDVGTRIGGCKRADYGNGGIGGHQGLVVNHFLR
jgi:hypothetical protein